MTSKLKLRRVTSSSFSRKKNNKIADSCVESKVKSGDEDNDALLAHPSPQRSPLMFRFGLTSPRRQRKNQEKCASPPVLAEDCFEEALSRRRIKPNPASPERFDLKKHGHELFEFMQSNERNRDRKHMLRLRSYADDGQVGLEQGPAVSDVKERLDVDIAYTVFAMRSIGPIHILALQGALILSACLDLSCVPVVIYSNRWSHALKAVFAMALVVSPYVFCKLSMLGDGKPTLTTEKAAIVSSSYLIVGISVEVVLAEVTVVGSGLPQLLLSALLVVFTANFHLPLRYSSVVTLGLVAFSSFVNSPRVDQALTTAALLLLAVFALFKIEQRSRADFAWGLRKFKEQKFAPLQSAKGEVEDSPHECEFQDSVSQPSRADISPGDSSKQHAQVSPKDAVKRLTQLHRILKSLQRQVALNDYVHIEQSISLALGVLEALELPETNMLATYRRYCRKSSGIVDSFLETEIGGGRLATALAMESGNWSDAQQVVAGDDKQRSPDPRGSKRSFLRRSSSTSGVPASQIQLKFARETLKIRSRSEKLIPSEALLECQLNTLQHLMLDWNFGEGGIFARLEDTTGSLPSDFSKNPLTLSTIAAMRHFGILEELKLDEDKMWKLLKEIEGQYASADAVPYHNAVHACDVVQSVTYLVYRGELLGDLPAVALLALLFGAASHDVGHPGTNNSFHVNTMSDLAITYSDRSVLEQYHLSVAFRTLRQPQCDITKDLSKGEANAFRELVIEMVLGTDISNHYANLASFKSSVAVNPYKPSIEPPVLNTMSSIKCKALLHCADVGSVAKDWIIYKQWIGLLFEEFYKQGEKERSLGFATASFMDRRTSSPAKAQQSFIKCIAMEVFTSMSDWLPDLKPTLVDSATTNLQHLESMRIVEQEQRATSNDISRTL